MIVYVISYRYAWFGSGRCRKKVQNWPCVMYNSKKNKNQNAFFLISFKTFQMKISII